MTTCEHDFFKNKNRYIKILLNDLGRECDCYYYQNEVEY